VAYPVTIEAFEGAAIPEAVATWLSRFDANDGRGRRAFFAWGNDDLNGIRRAGVACLEKAGFELASLVSERAVVSPTARLGVNSMVATGAIVGPGAEIAKNCVIESGSIVAASCWIGSGVWIGPGAIVEDGARIGDATTIGCGVQVASGVSIGEMCEVLVPGHYAKDLHDRTFYHPMFEEYVRVYRTCEYENSTERKRP
jgi:acetyltransferase-like isoleucine patch superfamily enzyme